MSVTYTTVPDNSFVDRNEGAAINDASYGGEAVKSTVSAWETGIRTLNTEAAGEKSHVVNVQKNMATSVRGGTVHSSISVRWGADRAAEQTYTVDAVTRGSQNPGSVTVAHAIYGVNALNSDILKYVNVHEVDLSQTSSLVAGAFQAEGYTVDKNGYKRPFYTEPQSSPSSIPEGVLDHSNTGRMLVASLNEDVFDGGLAGETQRRFVIQYLKNLGIINPTSNGVTVKTGTREKSYFQINNDYVYQEPSPPDRVHGQRFLGVTTDESALKFNIAARDIKLYWANLEYTASLIGPGGSAMPYNRNGSGVDASPEAFHFVEGVLEGDLYDVNKTNNSGEYLNAGDAIDTGTTSATADRTNPLKTPSLANKTMYARVPGSAGVNQRNSKGWYTIANGSIEVNNWSLADVAQSAVDAVTDISASRILVLSNEIVLLGSILDGVTKSITLQAKKIIEAARHVGGQ